MKYPWLSEPGKPWMLFPQRASWWFHRKGHTVSENKWQKYLKWDLFHLALCLHFLPPPGFQTLFPPLRSLWVTTGLRQSIISALLITVSFRLSHSPGFCTVLWQFYTCCCLHLVHRNTVDILHPEILDDMKCFCKKGSVHTLRYVQLKETSLNGFLFILLWSVCYSITLSY